MVGQNYTICNGGEDPNCADQFNFLDTTWDDHGNYYELRCSCSGTRADTQEDEQNDTRIKFLSE